jgi:cysteinyl-tRNA synthetase
VLRLAMLMTHYREPIDFSVRKLEEAENTLRKLEARRRSGRHRTGRTHPPEWWSIRFATISAVTRAFQADERTAPGSRGSSEMFAAGRLANFASRRLFRLRGGCWRTIDEPVGRRHRRPPPCLYRDKELGEADRIRDELLAQGIQLKDGKDPRPANASRRGR